MQFLTQVSIFFIVLMFLISGASKTFTLGSSEAARFAMKTGVAADVSQVIVFCAGLFELLAAGLVLYGAYKEDRMMASVGGYMLILFTLLATLVFYAFPLKYKPLLSNLSVMAGLYLMLNICFFKNEILS